jgi:hypothetical protein
LIKRPDPSADAHPFASTNPRADDGKKFTHEMVEVDANFFEFVKGM